MLLRFVLGLHVFSSLLALVLYGYDKRQAKNKGSRIPERVLHWVEGLGGWPGALLAQQIFRHKRSKAPYMAMFRVIVLTNLSLWLIGGFFYWSYSAPTKPAATKPAPAKSAPKKTTSTKSPTN
jgi:uncharacterized membrane protein YsdA (DUF1294 family)